MKVPTTRTRRALVLILYSEIPLLLGLLAFVALPTHNLTYLLFGIGASLLFGAPAGFALWAGRKEFGPDHERNTKRAMACFVLLLALLVLAATEVDAVIHESLDITDLWAPWTLLGLAILADAGAIWFTLTGLIPGDGRRWLHGVVGLAITATALYALLTFRVVSHLVELSGGVAAAPAEAASYGRDFVLGVVRPWALALLALRPAFLPALWRALTEVAQAERDAAAMAAHESWESPKPAP